MASRTEVLETLTKYFETKGRVLTSQEYAHETDTPIRIQQVNAFFGSWKRLERLLMADNANDGAATDIDAVLRARNEAAAAAQAQWQEASENQDVKARREAEAQYVAEIYARNAATPEGANANKVAIGGKLPQEQQDYRSMGALTVDVKETGEQVIVNTEPEVPTTSNEDPRTPQELRDAVAAENDVKTGSAKVDTSTAGGSTGQASTDTVDALGADTVDADNIKDKSTTNTSSTENTKVPADETKAAPTKK